MVTPKVRQGDVVKINFDPYIGHEQSGYRPAVVVSNRLSHGWISVVFLCPVTHTDRKNPFHHKLNGYDFVDGFVLCDQIKSMDLAAREYHVIGHLKDQDISEIIEKIEMLIEVE